MIGHRGNDGNLSRFVITDETMHLEASINGLCYSFQVKLERVLGLTVPSNAALDCDPHSGQVAYPAG